ncbi:MAG TPA: hypothetical protein VG826_29340 [Pirellulales bacterium]|nr:hypothetical protein [Pirellulales bacterium]
MKRKSGGVDGPRREQFVRRQAEVDQKRLQVAQIDEKLAEAEKSQSLLTNLRLRYQLLRDAQTKEVDEARAAVQAAKR